jgi:hypothetical protein
MNVERRDKWYGNTIEERIEMYPHELPIDAVGLWQIVSFGYDGFNLRGDDLIDFTRRCIIRLLEYGAKPVHGGKGTGYDWVLQPQYGKTSNEITDLVIAAWLAAGGGEPKDAGWQDFENPANPGGVWFALPKCGRYSVGPGG